MSAELIGHLFTGHIAATRNLYNNLAIRAAGTRQLTSTGSRLSDDEKDGEEMTLENGWPFCEFIRGINGGFGMARVAWRRYPSTGTNSYLQYR